MSETPIGPLLDTLSALRVELSLSRLNHRLPRGQTHPEIMQGTAAFHHEIAAPGLPPAAPVFDDAAARDAAVDRLAPPPTVVQGLGGPFWLPRPLLAAGCLGRHADRDLGERQREDAQSLSEAAPCGQGIRRWVGHGLIMGAAAIGVTEEKDEEQGMDEQDMFDRMVLVRATLTLRRFRRVLGADDAPFGPVMGQRGEAGVAVGAPPTAVGSSSSGATTGAASASETPSRWVMALRERAGASPRGRRAVRRTGRSTCSHGWALLWPMPHTRPWTTWSAYVFT